MKAWIRKNGRAVGGLYGIASAIAFWFDQKFLGATLASCALVAVASAEYTKKN